MTNSKEQRVLHQNKQQEKKEKPYSITENNINRFSIKVIYLLLFILFYPNISMGREKDIISKDSLSISDLSEEILSDSLPLSIIPTGNRNPAQIKALESKIDTARKINYWQITERTGEIIPTVPDTFLTDYFNRTNAEGQSVAMAYLGNLGLPGESRIFFERDDRSHFMFRDAYSAYTQTPGKFKFIGTKTPHSNISYQRAGDRSVREERLQGLLAINAGKKLGVGMNIDYLYARGYYISQSARHVDWSLFGNYLSDRHQVHLFFNSANYTNAENGGITDDNYISHPDIFDKRTINSREIPTNFSNNDNNTWNSLKGKQVYLNYHYYLGFERKTDNMDEDGNEIKQFIPVSSIIYTLDYKNHKKQFYTNDTLSINAYYNHTDFFYDNRKLNDSTSYWSLSNTIALSLREGFSEWAKFDLTAFVTQEVRQFILMDTIPVNSEVKQSSVYIGGELTKQTGKILRYSAQGYFGVLGANLGDLNLGGYIETRIPVWNDTAAIRIEAFIKNLSPTYYENHYQSKYFWWNNDFSKIKKIYIGGEITIPHTKTHFKLGVENVTNYIYFASTGYPRQYNENIQILSARLDQNFQYKMLHWDNQLVYQTSSNQNIIPLPNGAVYSSLYIQFKIAKVLTVQMGTNAHYWTKYYAPSYEPATQQFKLQNEVQVGNYPLLSGFLNCHLKQTRFFLEYYNAGAMFISPPEYFSLPHYPVNPTVLKLGLSVDFIN